MVAQDFIIKLRKGELAGGRFNRKVNTTRPLCQICKQSIGYFLERTAGFLRSDLTVPTGSGHPPSRRLSRCQRNHERKNNSDGGLVHKEPSSCFTEDARSLGPVSTLRDAAVDTGTSPPSVFTRQRAGLGLQM
ncbi:hypothetical protein CgunFtcFv8_015895 [Champsocephalus gunnari]|uniref:Uncharacterized protein n=1 Tax=Champsocephalus gunnari TaxID=52237 RepID=A0AAN8C6U2_CHAGU|nr:hypothetical protein CgunFtcFv8_015895 [Champsocephalus gunnari]